MALGRVGTLGERSAPDQGLGSSEELELELEPA